MQRFSILQYKYICRISSLYKADLNCGLGHYENGRNINTHSSIFERRIFLNKLKTISSQIYFYSKNEDKNYRAATKVDEVIDSVGAWDDNFELPLMVEASIQHGTPIPKICAVDVGISSLMGKRVYQEDKYILKDLKNEILCCAVFDGHGGSDCSSFCANHFEEIILKNLTEKTDLESTLHESILELHSSYSQWVASEKIGERSGSTCTICLLQNGIDLYIGHVGDSLAMLCRHGKSRRLTVDHCPSNLSEKTRIEKSGGSVVTDDIGRHMVNGELNMSRSIGDLHLKPFGVTALPDIRKYKLKHGTDAFILLATDGINYVLTDEEICNYIITHSQDPSTAAQSLTEQALSMSSPDNLTAMIIPCGAWGNFSKSTASMFYSFGIGRDMTKSSRFG